MPSVNPRQNFYFFLSVVFALSLTGRLDASGLLLFLIPATAGRRGTAVLTAFKDKKIGSMQIYSITKSMLYAGRSNVPYED